MAERVLEIGAPLYPVLNAFMRCRSRVSAVMGPLGSGKTFGAVERILAQMAEQVPNPERKRMSRWLAVRNTFPDLMGTTVRDFLAVFEGLGAFKGGGLQPPTFYAEFDLGDGTSVKAEVVFLALDREDSVRKIRGYQLTGVWLNEMKELVKPVVDMLDARHGRYPSMADGSALPTWHGMLGDTNACDEDHWYYRLAEEDRPDGWEFFRQPPGAFAGEKEGQFTENPEAENLRNLPEGYYRHLVQGKAPDWVKVNVLNEYGFTIDGKPVHPEYIDSVHCSDEVLEPDHRYPLLLGLDFGRTPACAIAQNLEHIGRWVGLDEYTSEDMSAATFAPRLKEYLDQNYGDFAIRGFGDPAGDTSGQTVETTPIEILRAQGLAIQPAPTNRPLLRRAAIANPIRRNCIDGKPAFLISPKMKLTRKGLMGGFCYRRLKIAGDDRYTDEPDKNIYSHPVEALEYALCGGGEAREAKRPPMHLRHRSRPHTARM